MNTEPEIPQDILDEVEGFNINYVTCDPAEERLKVARLVLAERQQCEAAIRICDAVIEWMVKHRFADPGEEIMVGDVIEALDGLMEA